VRARVLACAVIRSHLGSASSERRVQGSGPAAGAPVHDAHVDARRRRRAAAHTPCQLERGCKWGRGGVNYGVVTRGE
jgi:hypothetical protein